MAVRIRVDSREHRIHEFLDGLENCSIEQLDIGDIIIEHNDFSLVFERKTYDDLISSVNDGRYREQKQRMLSASPPRFCSYILEGSCDQSSSIYTGMVINTIFRDNMNIIWSRNPCETANWIRKIANKARDHPEYFTENTQPQSYIACVKTKTKKSSNIDKQTCYILQLCQIPGVSHKIATEIAKIYSSIPDLISALHEHQDPAQLLTSINMVGTKKAKTIIDYLL